MTITLPTITINNRDYAYTDTGESWIIHNTAPLMDDIHDRIVDTYQWCVRHEAEHDRRLPVSESRIAIDVMATDVAAVGTELGVRIYADYIAVPYTGEYRRSSVDSVVGNIEDQVLARVGDWVRNALDRHMSA